eukprot:Skav210790  [mRNA]  locus=scaffold275:156569:157099:+ [translate_table: standard]
MRLLSLAHSEPSVWFRPPRHDCEKNALTSCCNDAASSNNSLISSSGGASGGHRARFLRLRGRMRSELPGHRVGGGGFPRGAGLCCRRAPGGSTRPAPGGGGRRLQVVQLGCLGSSRGARQLRPATSMEAPTRPCLKYYFRQGTQVVQHDPPGSWEEGSCCESCGLKLLPAGAAVSD